MEWDFPKRLLERCCADDGLSGCGNVGSAHVRSIFLNLFPRWHQQMLVPSGE